MSITQCVCVLGGGGVHIRGLIDHFITLVLYYHKMMWLQKNKTG